MKKFSLQFKQRGKFIARIHIEIWFILSLAVGAFLAVLNGGLDPELAFTLLSKDPSAAMVLMSTLVPLLATFLAVSFRSRGLLLVVIFCKAFLFAYASILICSSIPGAGWLMASLLLIGDWLCLMAYHWLWVRCFAYKMLFRKADFLIVFLIILSTILCEHYWLYPFAESLFIN